MTTAQRIDSHGQPRQPYAMCNRVERGDTIKTGNLFKARVLAFNDGPMIVHPKEPGIVVRQADGEMIVEQMTWGFPVSLKSKKTGLPLKPILPSRRYAFWTTR